MCIDLLTLWPLTSNSWASCLVVLFSGWSSVVNGELVLINSFSQVSEWFLQTEMVILKEWIKPDYWVIIKAWLLGLVGFLNKVLITISFNESKHTIHTNVVQFPNAWTIRADSFKWTRNTHEKQCSSIRRMSLLNRVNQYRSTSAQSESRDR